MNEAPQKAPAVCPDGNDCALPAFGRHFSCVTLRIETVPIVKAPALRNWTRPTLSLATNVEANADSGSTNCMMSP